MTVRPLLSRRRLLTRAVAGVTTLLGGGVSLTVAGDRVARAPSLEHALLRLCSKLSYPETVGKACLEMLPAKETKQTLMVGMLRDGGLIASQPISSTQLARRLRDSSRDDFRTGRIVNVDGWVLSLTETRLYALASLLSAPGAASGHPVG